MPFTESPKSISLGDIADAGRVNFWYHAFEMCNGIPGVKPWRRESAPDKDYAVRSYPSQGVRLVSQNFKITSPNTAEMALLRSHGVWADTIFISIHMDSFSHRLGLRAFGSDLDAEAVAHLWLMGKKGPLLASLPDDFDLTLSQGLSLILSTYHSRGSHS